MSRFGGTKPLHDEFSGVVYDTALGGGVFLTPNCLDFYYPCMEMMKQAKKIFLIRSARVKSGYCQWRELLLFFVTL